jgi:hypothetical protein
MTGEQEYQDLNLFTVFYGTKRRLPQEIVEWSQSPEGKKALEDWEADYRATLARWGEEEARWRKEEEETSNAEANV